MANGWITVRDRKTKGCEIGDEGRSVKVKPMKVMWRRGQDCLRNGCPTRQCVGKEVWRSEWNVFWFVI